jgi:preprotein translocase subunit SecG
MISFFTVLFVLAALLLIGVILVQQPKTSGGLFAGTGQSLLGTSGKTFWTKATIGLAAFFMFLCIVLSILPRFEKPSSVTDIIDKQQQAAQMPTAVAPPKVATGSISTNPVPQSVPVAAQQPVAPPSAPPQK